MSFLFLLLAWMRKSKRGEKERKREDLPYYYDDDDVLFYEKYTTGNAQESEKKCADGWSEFDFLFFFPPRDT